MPNSGEKSSCTDLPYLRLNDVPLSACLLSRNFCVAARCLAQILWRIRDNLLAFLPSHVHETCNDGDPVQIIRDDRAVCGTVLPAEKRIEDTPTARAVFKG